MSLQIPDKPYHFIVDNISEASTGWHDGSTCYDKTTNKLYVLDNGVFNESGAIETAWADYSATSTIVGFASFTVKSIWTRKIGNTVFVNFELSGASNATGISFTVPYTSAANPTTYFRCARASDNSGTDKSIAHSDFAGNSATVTIVPDNAGGAWTNTNNKSVAGQFWYET